jgi:hypothetical protein
MATLTLLEAKAIVDAVCKNKYAAGASKPSLNVISRSSHKDLNILATPTPLVVQPM